jgi:hypothetical protein
MSGRYVVAFVESASAVSPVFQRKAEDVLEEFGIEDPDPESFYDVEAFGDALREVENRAGEQTVMKAGERMVDANVQIVAQESARAGLEVMGEQHEAIHRNYTRPAAGGYEVEAVEPRRFRVGIYGDYPFPLSLPKGAVRGTVKVTEPEATMPDVSEVPAADEETAALVVTW